jgi:predicted RNA-binding protein (virulence factor B family)
MVTNLIPNEVATELIAEQPKQVQKAYIVKETLQVFPFSDEWERRFAAVAAINAAKGTFSIVEVDVFNTKAVAYKI